MPCRNKPKRLKNRGIAMIMVMLVVVAASIIAAGLLASANAQAQLTGSAADQVQARYMSESGINLAMYYMRNPSASPVALATTTEGLTYYPGESNIALPGMDGTVSISVTQTGYGKYNIASTGTYNGHSCTQNAAVTVSKALTIGSAALMAGNQKLTTYTTIAGGLQINGSLTTVTGTTVTGVIVATNGSSFGGTNVASGSAAAPGTAANDLTLMNNMPYYYYNGKRYTAKTMSTNYGGGTLLDTNTTANPLNVWYHTGGKFTGTTTLNGTLISTSSSDGGGLKFEGNITITPVSNNFPALVVKNDLIIKDTPRTLKFNGVTYIGGTCAPTGANNNTNSITIKGAFISPTSNVLSTFGGILTITYDSTRATLKGFSDTNETVQQMTAQSFEQTNGRPQ